ncbi:MAG: hypothetical protein D6814_14275 [Calditrichaeota bacterium]|nr:MAG: hypothetical protein D6814_14275 [Calditrichota bacterium]
MKIINNLRLVPAPFDRVKKSQMLFCYFEIYNLQSSGIRNQYEIAYTVSSQREGRSIFHKISRLVSHPRDISISMKQAQPLQQDSSQELIGLDLHALSPGTYNLEIIVTDPQNRDLAARTTQKLVVVD